jgi:hypothetical protein
MDPMDWARILKATGFNEVELRDTRYDLVIHLVCFRVFHSFLFFWRLFRVSEK